MELKLVTTDNQTETISLEEFLKKIKEDTFFYFHRDTSFKDILDLAEEVEKKGYKVYHREVKYSLEDDGYMYEIHIL
jgi:hypothetical protein